MNATLANCPPPVDRCGWTPLPLRPEEAALAYPLLMASEGGTCEPLDAWRARVRNWLRVKRGRGIVTLRNGGGVIGSVVGGREFGAVAPGGHLSPRPGLSPTSHPGGPSPY